MLARDVLRFATRALTEKKLRAVLTIVGIMIGPATIVALEGATQGYSNAATARFSNVGSTTIFLSPIGRGVTLTSADIPEISSLAGVTYVVPYVEMSGQMTQGGESIGVEVVGIDFSQISHVLPSLSLALGDAPAASDQVGAAIGYSVAYPDIQGATNTTVNQVITVSNLGRSAFGFGGPVFFSSSTSASTSLRSFVVTGVYNKYGTGFGISPDDSIFIPLASAQLISKSESYTGAMVVASSPSTVSQVITELTNTLGNSYRETSAGSIVSTIESVTSGTDTLLLAVGATSVLVAFIGIMTTMLTSVMERTKEIGVLKALGSSSRGILLVFLAEASVTGLIGGIAGASAGYGLSYVVIKALGGSSLVGGGGGAVAVAGAGGTAVFRASFGGGAASAASSASTTLTITPAVTPELVALAILLAVVVGTFGGLLPAWRASRLNPVEALRRS